MADNKTNSQKKDEIIAMQLDIIRKMTENNIKRLSDDIWGATRTTNTQSTQTTQKPIGGEESRDKGEYSADKHGSVGRKNRPHKGVRRCDGNSARIGRGKVPAEREHRGLKEGAGLIHRSGRG